MRRLLPHVASLSLVLGAAWVAVRAGGGSAVSVGAPRVTGAALPPASQPSPREAHRVVRRLVEGLSPGASPARAESFALSAEDEAIDRRDALVAPIPATLAFRVTVPRGAVLTFAPALARTPREPTRFAVHVVDASGHAHEIYQRLVAPDRAGRWLDDARADLTAFVGQDVEVRFETRASPAGDLATASEPPVSTDDAPAALWGAPTLLGAGQARAPFNVLWIVADLRADALASLHDPTDDAAAALLAGDARLPKLEGLLPALDALASRGVRFSSAYTVAPDARGLEAMLSGTRPGAPRGDALPGLLRRADARTQAFAEDASLFAAAGARDLGFDGVVTDGHAAVGARVASRAVAWIAAHADERFFLQCVLGDHGHPPLTGAVPSRLAPRARQHFAAAIAIDAAVAALLAALDTHGLRERTIVIVTSDRAAPLSAMHGATFAHPEEVTHVPLLVALPDLLASRLVTARVQTLDVAPTLLDLEQIDTYARARMPGRSLLALARGESEPDPRVVLTEGQGRRAVLSGRYRLVVGDVSAPRAPDALYDLRDDPGERHDLARERPDLVLEMRARLDAAAHDVAPAGSFESLAQAEVGSSVVHLRFAGGGGAHRVTGTLTASDAVGRGGDGPALLVEVAGLARESLRVDGSRAEVAITVLPNDVVGLDVRVSPPGAKLRWELTLDERPWPPGEIFAGPFGLAAPSLARGLDDDDALALAAAVTAPRIDPARDRGLFVWRAPIAGSP